MSSPPRGLRPRRPATPLTPHDAQAAADVEVRLGAAGAVALIDADMDRALAVGRTIAGPTWIEVDARALSGAQALLGAVWPATTLRAGERSEDALLDALDAAGWDLLLTHVTEGWLPVVEALFDARARGEDGPRLLTLTPLAPLALSASQRVTRTGPPPPTDLAPRAHAAWEWLAGAGAPCSAAALATLTGDPAVRESLERLEVSGLVQRLEGGWAATSAPTASTSPQEALARGRALRAAAAAPIDHLAAASAFIEGGDAAAALDTLDAVAATGVSALPPTLLAAALSRSADPRLDRWRLEAAVLCGSPDTLAQVPAPLSQDAETRAAYAEVLYLRGHLAAARALLTALRDEDTLDTNPTAQVRVARVAALIEAQAGAHDAALAALDEVTPRDSAEAAVLDAARALALALAERDAEALEVVQARWSDHRGLTGLARERHVSDLLVALVTCERLDLARRYRDEAAPRVVGPMAYLLALVATQSGDLDRADDLLSRCESAFDDLGAWHARTRALRIRWCLARGALSGLEARIDALMRAAERLGDRGLFALGQTYHAALAVLVRCAPPPERAWPADATADAPPEGWPGVFLGRDSRRGGSARQRAWACVMMGHRALLEGHADQGLHALDAAIALARSTGFTLDEVGALRLRLDACFLLGDADGLRATDAALVALGAEESSRAIAVELSFVRALQRAPASPAALLAAADAWDAATRTARRARALLGAHPDPQDTGALDALDVQVLARARPLCPAARVSGALDAPWAEAWLLDHRERVLHRPEQAPVELAATPLLWTVLTHLASAGELDKEALLRVAWGVEDYHPLRDDNRLQVTMRKLRGLVELDPAAPRVLRTTSAGYGFASDLRVVHINEA